MLFRKMLRDLKQNKTQFISIFLMAFLSVYIYAGIGGEWHGMRNTLNDIYERTNFADAWIYGSDFSAQDVQALRALDDVTDVTRRTMLEAVTDLPTEAILTIYRPEDYSISTNLHLEGSAWSDTTEGIWVDELFARANDLQIGDMLAFTAMDSEYEAEILGFILNPEYIFDYSRGEMVPDHQTAGYAYASPTLFPEALGYNTLVLTACADSDMDILEQDVSKALDHHYSVWLERENHPSHMMIDSEIEQHKMFANVFPFVFLAIAMLTILTTMTRMVHNQRTQIGTLKALGFNRRRIVWHYVSYGLFVSLGGALLGAAVGPLTLPPLFYDAMQTTFTLDQWVSAWDISFWIVAVLCGLLCGFFTYTACRGQLRDTPAQTLRPAPPKNPKQNHLKKTKLWRRLGFNVQWNLRDISRSRSRSLMAITGVIGCMSLLLCAFGMRDSFDDILEWQYSDLIRYESNLTLSDHLTFTEAEAVAATTNGELIMEGNVEIRTGPLKKTGELLVYDELSLIRFTAPDRTYIELPDDEFCLSYKMAKTLGVTIGDEIEWHIYGEEEWRTATIGTLYRTPTSQGIAISRSFLESSGYEFLPTSVITSEIIDNPLDHVSSVSSIAALRNNYDTFVESMYVMVYILIIAACLLAIVVLYNLGVLSFTEQQRELATLKVLGYKSGRIRKLLVTQTILLSLTGILIGLFAGRLLLGFMISTVSESFDMMTIISPLTSLISAAISFLISVLVTFVFSRNVRNIDMVSSLKGLE